MLGNFAAKKDKYTKKQKNLKKDLTFIFMYGIICKRDFE